VGLDLPGPEDALTVLGDHPTVQEDLEAAVALAGVVAAVVVGYSMHLNWGKDSGLVAQHQVLDQLAVIVGAVVVVGLAVVETSVGRPAVLLVAVVEGASAAAVVAAWVGGRATLIVCPT